MGLVQVLFYLLKLEKHLGSMIRSMIDIIDVCGWLGSFSYAVYSIPQAIYVYRQGNTENLSSTMIILLLVGATCSLIYILPDFVSPLFYNFFYCFYMLISHF